MADTIRFRVPNLATKGKGKGWVAECHKPWVAGDNTCATYLTAPFPDVDTYELEPGKVYAVGEPKRVANDDDPFGVGQASFSNRLYYLYVHADGHKQEISKAEADRRLSAQKAGARTSSVATHLHAPEPITVTAVIERNRVVFTNANGKSVSLTLSVDTAKKLQQLGGDHGEI